MMETLNSNLFQSHCTWKSIEGKNISEAISWSDRNENSDIEETIQAENCVLLEIPTETAEAGPPTSECRLMFYSQPPYLIQKVTVLCEARLIEVYGRHAEYLKTIRNQIVDEVDDMVVFRGDVQLERASPECSLKFTGLKAKTSMWLYGVTVKVIPIQGNTPPLSTLLSPTNNMPGSVDRNRNNAQFMSLMSSLFGPPIDPRPVAPPTPQPAAAPPQPDMMGLLMSIMQANQAPSQSPVTSASPQLTSPMQQQSVMQLINQIAQQQIVQHASVPDDVPLVNEQRASPLTNGVTNTHSPNQQSDTSANAEILNEEAVEVPKDEETEIKLDTVPVPEVQTANLPTELTLEATTSTQPAGISKSAGATPSREVVFELPAETIDQITDSVVNNIECGLENMEQRLWGKIVQRLTDMETRIMGRIEEVVEALREVEEGLDGEDERETPEEPEDDRDLEEDTEEETDSVLQV